MKKYLFIIFLILLSLISAQSYSGTISSDTTTINYLNSLCLKNAITKSDEAIRDGLVAVKLSKQIGYQKGIASAYNNLGIAYYYKKERATSILYLTKSLMVSHAIQYNKEIALTYNNIGNIYFNESNYAKAYTFYIQAENIQEKIFDSIGQAKTLNNIGLIYRANGENKKALLSFFYALKIFTKNNEKFSMAKTINNICNTYLDLKEYDNLYKFSTRLLKLSEEIKSETQIANAHNLLGNLYLDKKLYSKGLAYFQEALSIYVNLKDTVGIAISQNNIGNLFLTKKEYTSALEYFTVAIKNSNIMNQRYLSKEIYYNIADSYYNTNDYKRAYENLNSYLSLKDSIYNKEYKIQITELQTKYETAKKEKEIALLNQDKQKQYLLINNERETKRMQLFIMLAVILLITILSVYLFTRNRLKQKLILERTLSEQQKLRFKDIIEALEKERKRIAEDLHDGLGQLMSTARLNVSSIEDVMEHADNEDKKIYKNSLDLIDESCREIRNISHNLMPGALIKLGLIPAIKELSEKISSSGKLQVIFKNELSSIRLDESVEIALYRVIQEVLNNIINHSEASKSEINIFEKNNYICLSIEENGKGIDKEKIRNSKGIGWKNIFSRIEMLNGTIEITSVVGEKTKIYIEVPL